MQKGDIRDDAKKRYLMDWINLKDYGVDINKFQKKTGIIYNTNCIKHIQLPDETVKHLTTRLEMFENSDRLACLINDEDGIILNDRIFHFKGVSVPTTHSKHTKKHEFCSL